MGKKRRSVSISEENDEFLKNHHNASALIDELITEYRNGGREDKAILRYRLEELQTEIASLEARVEKKKELREDIESRVEQKTEKQRQVVEEAVEVLGGSDLSPAQLEHWAEKADMSEPQFQEAYNEVREE